MNLAAEVTASVVVSTTPLSILSTLCVVYCQETEGVSTPERPTTKGDSRCSLHRLLQLLQYRGILEG